MAWIERTTAPVPPQAPYDWGAVTEGECTWYAYWRVQEGGLTPPCWQSGSGSTGTGKYTHAKDWLQHYRDPWVVKSTSDSLVPGDIIIFTGTYGHCAVVEKVNSNNTLTITDYNLLGGSGNFGRKTNYVYPNALTGTGACIGALSTNGTVIRYLPLIKHRRKYKKIIRSY